MNYDNIIRLIILIGIIQGLLFNLIVFFNRNRINTAIKYLNIVVLCLSLNNIREFVFDGDYLPEAFIHFYLSAPWFFLIVPFFYIFLIHYLKLNKDYQTYFKVTLIIFFIESIIRIWIIFLVEDNEILFTEYIIVEEMINALYSIFIFGLIVKLVFFNKDATKYIGIYDDIKWVKSILKFGFLVMVLWIIVVITYYFTRQNWLYDPLKIIYSILVYWLGYQALISAKVVQDRIMLRKYLSVDNLSQKVLVDKGNDLNEKHLSDYHSIENYIIQNQKFLDPLLSLDKVSDELGYSPGHISKLINENGKQNFSDLINSLRVNYAKQILSDPVFLNYTIVSVGLESGFNSKSTFYSAFKKFTNKTPSEFRETILN
jgi:AraC-like DNA-binding protein